MGMNPHLVCPRPQIGLPFPQAYRKPRLNPRLAQPPLPHYQTPRKRVWFHQIVRADVLLDSNDRKRGLQHLILPKEADFYSFHCLRKQ